jgi:hypothetical protein
MDDFCSAKSHDHTQPLLINAEFVFPAGTHFVYNSWYDASHESAMLATGAPGG